MVWEEIRRILAGAEQADRENQRRQARAGMNSDQEFAVELAPGQTSAQQAQSLALGGEVRVEPAAPKEGEALIIVYQGMLARQGASGIILHCGYGRGAWEDVQDIPMTPRGFQVWQATVIPGQSGPFSFCFRDTAGNWDNNHGRNWTVEVQPA